MGWDDCHMHEFVFEKRRFAAPMLEQYAESGLQVEDEGSVRLGELLRRVGQKLLYRYDFGDCWEHDIILKERVGSRDFIGVRCVAGEGACPLEDCGGVLGHKSICDYLEGKLDKAAASEYREWVPKRYHPDVFDLDEVNRGR